jgi:hypothetical protein
VRGHIVAIGGGTFLTDDPDPRLDAFILALTGKARLRDGLGFLPGSCCPHYDSNAQRRPLYRAAVDRGELAPGYAADDYAALHFHGTDFLEAVALREGARGYRVEPGLETPLGTRIL